MKVCHQEKEKEVHAAMQEDSIVEKSGELVSLFQLVIALKSENHNCNGCITMSRSKHLESGFNSNHHLNKKTNVVDVHIVRNKGLVWCYRSSDVYI